MTLQEMIELAILDAMGLLDEEERLAFELAFRAAAPPVQAQVRREQPRLSRIESLLPQVAPPAELRAAVIEAVRREIATAQPASVNPAVLVASSMVRARAVSPIWRAAALGLAAASLILGITTFGFQARYDELGERLRSESTVNTLNTAYGTAFVQKMLFDRDTKRVVFKPQGQSRGMASLWIHPEMKEAMFFCQAIASQEGRTLKLAIVDENDHIVKDLATFTSSGELTPLRVTMSPNQTGHIAVVTSKKASFDSVLVRAELPGSL